jgi:tetratricopeptide (TPR) repeat protein
MAAVIAASMSVLVPAAMAQPTSPQCSAGVAIQGKVIDPAGGPAADALVRLEQNGVPGAVETKTNAAGAFSFPSLQTGNYILSAEKAGLRSRAAAVSALSQGDRKLVDLVLQDSAAPSATIAASPSSMQAMEFADKPNFTVAGVTDWTAAGGHGSDTSLRTSEALTRETLTLQAYGAAHNVPVNTGGTNASEGKLRAAVTSSPQSFQANRQLGDFYLHAGRYQESIPLLEASYRIDPADCSNEYDLAVALKEAGDLAQARAHAQKLLAHGESAAVHRLAAEVDEKLGDPLTAVHEFEQAVRLDPSEQNYFAWGSELLFHRAVLQAQEVFQRGAAAYPKSERMLTALGTALFSSARYDQAALRLCDASDLSPADPEPYIFMGKIEMVAPSPLPCVEQKLARFVEQQPGNSLANYLYAMAIWKRQELPAEQQVLQKVKALLTKAVTLDPKNAEAYLQMGNLCASQRDYHTAIGFYLKAIDADPQLAEVHYRLGMAYDRTDEPAKAKQEFQLHTEIRKQQAAEVDRQRREVKQFLVGGQPTYPTQH